MLIEMRCLISTSVQSFANPDSMDSAVDGCYVIHDGDDKRLEFWDGSAILEEGGKGYDDLPHTV